MALASGTMVVAEDENGENPRIMYVAKENIDTYALTDSLIGNVHTLYDKANVYPVYGNGTRVRVEADGEHWKGTVIRFDKTNFEYVIDDDETPTETWAVAYDCVKRLRPRPKDEAVPYPAAASKAIQLPTPLVLGVGCLVKIPKPMGGYTTHQIFVIVSDNKQTYTLALLQGGRPVMRWSKTTADPKNALALVAIGTLLEV